MGRTGAELNGFGKSDWFKASIIVSGGVSGGISSRIAGGSFMDGFKQGLITAGLNHVASMVANELKQGSSYKVYDDDGDYVGKMKIKTYREANYDDGSKGLVIEMSFKAVGDKYDSFNWVQTIFTNDSYGSQNQYRVYNDPLPGQGYHDSSPFYWNEKMQVDMYNASTKTYTFYDMPSRGLNNTLKYDIFWRAELTLVGINSNGAYAVNTFKYGFNYYYQNNHFLHMPLQIIPYTGRYKWLK